MWKDKRLLVLLATGSLTTMAGGVVAPVLPEIVRQLQLNQVLAGNLVSLHCLTIALFSPLLGILADRKGKVKVLLPSLILYSLFGVAGAFFDNIWLLLLMRAGLGAASGGIAAASLGLLGNLYQEPQRSTAIGYATSTLTLAGILFPVLGGVAGAGHWQYAFYLYGVGLPLALLAGLVLREKQDSQKGVAIDAQQLQEVLANSQTGRLLLAVSIASAAMYAFLIYVPQYLKLILNSNPVLNGVVLASTALGAAVISAFSSRLVGRWGFGQTVALGFGLMAAVFALMLGLHQLIGIFPAAVVFGLGFGLVLPCLYAALAGLAPAHLRSSVLAAATGAGFLGQFLSPVFLGPVLGGAGFVGVFFVGALAALIGGVLVAFGRR